MMKKESTFLFAITALILCLFFWSSAFVGIREGLKDYDPGSLALFRYLVASFCMIFFYLRAHHRHAKISFKEVLTIFLVGVIGFTIYNVALNYGEVSVNAGISSFIVSQMPVGIVILAAIFLKEKLSPAGWLGMLVSTLGVTVIALSGKHNLNFSVGIIYLIIATVAGSIYSVLHKPFLKKFNPVEFTSYAIWSGTLVLLIYLPTLIHEIPCAHLSSTLAAIYLGVFPGAIGYMAWCYVLYHFSTAKAGSSLYLMPLIATFLGWLVLGEVPAVISLVGGVIALLGAIIVNACKH
jgi:drug/metabolite transporter (DMT)-like permease